MCFTHCVHCKSCLLNYAYVCLQIRNNMVITSLWKRMSFLVENHYILFCWHSESLQISTWQKPSFPVSPWTCWHYSSAPHFGQGPRPPALSSQSWSYSPGRRWPCPGADRCRTSGWTHWIPAGCPQTHTQYWRHRNAFDIVLHLFVKQLSGPRQTDRVLGILWRGCLNAITVDQTETVLSLPTEYQLETQWKIPLPSFLSWEHGLEPKFPQCSLDLFKVSAHSETTTVLLLQCEMSENKGGGG